MKDLRVYARPPLPFYLAAGEAASSSDSPTWRTWSGAGNSTSWALLDMALMRQAKHLRNKTWTDPARTGSVVREIPTTLNPPTLLDIDPAARAEAMIDASAPLRLLRRKRMEDVR